MKQWHPSLLQIQAIIPMYLLKWFMIHKAPRETERERETQREQASKREFWPTLKALFKKQTLS